MRFLFKVASNVLKEIFPQNESNFNTREIFLGNSSNIMNLSIMFTFLYSASLLSKTKSKSEVTHLPGDNKAFLFPCNLLACNDQPTISLECTSLD